MKYNYKLVILPVFTWNIKSDDIKTLKEGVTMLQDFRCDIGYLREDRAVTCRVYLDMAEEYRYIDDDILDMKEFGITVKFQNLAHEVCSIDCLDLEYELYVDDIPYYRYFSMIDSKMKHYHTLPINNFSLNFVFRVDCNGYIS